MHGLETIPVQTLGYAIVGGILPVLIWLYFLLREDERCPEPRPLITIAFFVGMLAVLLALPLEKLLKDFSYSHFTYCLEYLPLCIPIVIGWAAIEETLKYAVAALFVLWRKDVNEPIDLVIYMITVALGFAALENAFFLIEPFSGGHFINGLTTNNLRFIGSTLLHVIASSTVGFTLAFAYKKSKVLRAGATALGLILAIALHSTFNFFILQRDGSHTLLAFFVVWSGVVLFFALFEILRYFEYRNLPKNVC